MNKRGGEYGTALQVRSPLLLLSFKQLTLSRQLRISAMPTMSSYFSTMGRKSTQSLLASMEPNSLVSLPRYATRNFLTHALAAVYTGDEDTIRLLLKMGADVNAFGGHYSYPIIAAVDQGDSSATKILLDHNAHVNVRGGEDNWPVICLAASTLLKEDLKLILKNVADINATCDKGTTALINCADACDAEGIQFLLDNDADVHVVSESYGTALHAAA